VSKKKTPPDVALHRKYARKPVREFTDYDYLDKLSPEEREWLNKFSLEYYQAALGGKKTLHPKAKHKSCYDANNARNRDIWHKADRQPEVLDDQDDDEPEQGGSNEQP